MRKATMNEIYQSVGKKVSGKCFSEPFVGKIKNVRAKAGDDLSVEVQSDGSSFVILGSALMKGGNHAFTDLVLYK